MLAMKLFAVCLFFYRFSTIPNSDATYCDEHVFSILLSVYSRAYLKNDMAVFACRVRAGVFQNCNPSKALATLRFLRVTPITSTRLFTTNF